MFRKLSILITFLVLGPLAVGLFGALHDLLLYLISPEYMTAYKFEQAELGESLRANPPLAAMMVGWQTNWWAGLPLALLTGLGGFLLYNKSAMLRAILSAWKYMLYTVLVFMGLGYVVGRIFVKSDAGWYVPEGVENADSYLLGMSMQNFFYLGAAAGLMIALITLYRGAGLSQLRRKSRS